MTATGPRWSAGGSVEVTRSCLGMVDTSGIATNDCGPPTGSGGQRMPWPDGLHPARSAKHHPSRSRGCARKRPRHPSDRWTSRRQRVRPSLSTGCLGPFQVQPRAACLAIGRHQAADRQEDTVPGSDVNLLLATARWPRRRRCTGEPVCRVLCGGDTIWWHSGVRRGSA